MEILDAQMADMVAIAHQIEVNSERIMMLTTHPISIKNAGDLMTGLVSLRSAAVELKAHIDSIEDAIDEEEVDDSVETDSTRSERTI